MNSFLFESPLWIGLGGSFVSLIAGFFWSQTGNKPSAYASLGLAIATIALVVVNIQVETPREQIASLLDEIAGHLEANNREAIYSFIHPAAAPAVQQARQELPRFEFSKAKVTRIKNIAVQNDASPPSCLAEFNVAVELTTQGQKFRVPRFVRVYFAKQGDQWLVRDYEHYEPTAGFRE